MLAQFLDPAQLSALGTVIFIDIVMSGDNAIVIGMAVAGLPKESRAKIIMIGIGAATLMRVAFALVAMELLAIVGLLLAGGILLAWVSWKMWREIREQAKEKEGAEEVADPAHPHDTAATTKTTRQAIIQIIVADISMSLDNVLAVAGAAREHPWVLYFGLALSVALMAFASGFIARLLTRYHWLAYIGLAIIVFVAADMIWDGTHQVVQELKD